MTPAEWFDLIEERGPGLRAAGLLEFKMDGVEFRLAALAPELPAVQIANSGPTEPEPMNPLDNPGLYPDGIVPGYTLHPED